ncbi:hypothetical protein A2U01_0104041, partial [Trifolium medium]|nr:hypothetical protein [Trifolium medium]
MLMNFPPHHPVLSPPHQPPLAPPSSPPPLPPPPTRRLSLPNCGTE